MTRIERTDLARDALYDKVNQIADEQVSLAHNQTITGAKIFRGNLSKQNGSATKGETENNRYWSITMDDKDGINNVNHLSMWQTAIVDGNTETALYAYKNEANTNTYNSIKLIYPLNGNPYATCPDPTDTTSSTNSKHIVNVGWGSRYFVTLDTDQTITGDKKFSGDLIKQVDSFDYNGIYVQNTLLTKGTAPATNTGGRFVFQDKGGKNLAHRIGGCETVYTDQGEIQTKIVALQPTANSSTYAQVAVIYPPADNPYAIAPSTRSDRTNGTDIVTRDWLPKDTRIVHSTGNETIAGTKTFSSTISGSINGNAATVTNGVYTTGNQTIGGNKTFSNTISGSINGNAATVTNGVYTTGNQTIGGNKTFSGATKFTADPSVTRDYAGFNLNASNITKGTAPSADTLYSRYRLRDKDGTIMSSVYGIYRSNKSNQLGFEVMKANANADTAYSRLALVVESDGTGYGISPTPAVSSTGTTIATAGYINNKFKKVSTLPASPDTDTFYFIPE